MACDVIALRLAALQALFKQDQQVAAREGCSSPDLSAAREREPLTGRSSGFTAAVMRCPPKVSRSTMP